MLDRSQSSTGLIRSALTYGLLGLLMLSVVVPFLWMVSTSLKSQGQTFVWPPVLIPQPIVWQNYADVLAVMPFVRYFLNTSLYAVAVVAGQLASCSLAGYAFAKLKFPGRDVLFLLYLGTMMIPQAVTLIPGFILMRWFGWVNTIWAMTIPGMFGSAFGTFLMRQFFLTLPTDLDDAAAIDGADKFRIFWQINLPLARSALTVLAVFTLISVWNDFMWPLVVLRDPEVLTLTVGLARLKGQYVTNWPQLMAAATMAVMPLILVFVFTQRYFTQGIAWSGLAGR